MNYRQCTNLLNFLNHRMRSFTNPWYSWAIRITWNKLRRWAELLGYKGDIS